MRIQFQGFFYGFPFPKKKSGVQYPRAPARTPSTSPGNGWGCGGVELLADFEADYIPGCGLKCQRVAVFVSV